MSPLPSLSAAVRFALPAALACLVLGLAPASAQAGTAASAWDGTDKTRVRLIAAADATDNAGTIALGLEFRMAPGWKVYWRAPGDAGYPPSIDWTGSGNLAAAEMSWPLPHRFSVLGLESLGYKEAVVYPIAATLATPGRALRLRANVDFLTCDAICVPYEAKLALDLDAGPAAPSAHAHGIDRWRARVPGDGTAAALAIESAEALGRGAGALLRVTVRSDGAPLADPDLFVEGPDGTAFDKPAVRLIDGGKRAVLAMRVWGLEDIGAEATLAGTGLTVTLADGTRAAEARITPAAPSQGQAASPEAALGAAPADGLGAVLLLAVLGGLILNLMPCVLPVLSIKLLGAVGHGGRDSTPVRLSFLASAAGIVAAFLVIASGLVALKSAGLAVGWGIQFQHPWFLILMTVVVTVFACNLWGFFEVHLPRWLADAGEHTGHVHGLGGHFLTGAFATLLATPCSAPFLGTAVGFALARGAADIYAVFAALGLGLALPYLAVALLPRLATMLPKPGRWMVILRRLLGFALAATAAWLVTVLAVQAGTATATAVAALMAGIVAALFLGRKAGRAWPGMASALALAVLALIVPGFAPGDNAAGITAKDPAREAALDGLWQPFDAAAIPALIAAGKTVFVDVTAEWCLTCKLNKALVLAVPDVLARLSGPDVVAMQADWTQPDDAIAAYLAGFGRYGIPFDAVYGPGLPGGLALPELLSAEAVTGALLRAGVTATAGGP